MEELSVLQTACSVGQLRDVNLTIDEYFEVGYWPRDVVVSEISKLDDWERGIVLRVLTDYDGPERRRLLVIVRPVRRVGSLRRCCGSGHPTHDLRQNQ